MWRPTTVGVVVGERELTLTRAPRRSAKVVVRVGRPVRQPRAGGRDPWWCPVVVDGLGPSAVRAVPGEDALQALMLALEFIGNVLPLEAERAGGHLEWLGERYRPVFADSMIRGLVERGLQNMSEAPGRRGRRSGISWATSWRKSRESGWLNTRHWLPVAAKPERLKVGDRLTPDCSRRPASLLAARGRFGLVRRSGP